MPVAFFVAQAFHPQHEDIKKSVIVDPCIRILYILLLGKFSFHCVYPKMKTKLKIFVYPILTMPVGMVRASGLLDILNYGIAPFTERLGYPTEAVPLTLMRLISSAASTGLLLDLFERYGPNSFLGRFISIISTSALCSVSFCTSAVRA